MTIGLQSGSPAHPADDTGAGSTTTMSLTNVTNGCGVLALFASQNSPTPIATSVTADCGGDAMTAVGSLFNLDGQQMQIFYLAAYSGTTGTKTITFTVDHVSFLYTRSAIALDTAIALDATGSASSDTINLTATVNNDFGISIAVDGSSTPATQSGWTAISIGSPNNPTAAQYKADVGASGSITITQTGTIFQGILAALFKASGAVADTLMGQCLT